MREVRRSRIATLGATAAIALAILSGTCTAEPAATSAPPQSAESAQAMQDAERAKFEAFIVEFRDTALKAGIAAATYDRSMAGIALNPRVEQLDLQQPEFVKPIWDYLDGAVSPDRIAKGQQSLAAGSTMLANIEERFGIPKEILVAIWGIESNYGQAMGRFNMFEALATLAYDGPRQDYARRELIDAFKMEEQEHLDPKETTSSWAGAFGQTQFVPSAFLQFAVDGDGDGKRDLWHSPADALASSASLLTNGGWEKGAGWGYEVVLPAGFSFEQADIDRTKPVAEWRKLGVKTATGADLPRNDTPVSIVIPAGARGPAFVVLDNFRAVLKYNNAVAYALAVCLLADRLKGDAPVVTPWPRDEVPLTRDELVALQSDLQKLGYDPGSPDGMFGRKGRTALREYQQARGLPADGFATEMLLVRMEREIAAKGN